MQLINKPFKISLDKQTILFLFEIYLVSQSLKFVRLIIFEKTFDFITIDMADSTNSLSSKDVSSTVSLYEASTNGCVIDNSSTHAVYELDPDDSISRPLSRGSVTSGVSMMATKDGVDGEKIKRLGIPQYSLNLLNSMAHNQYKKMNHLGPHNLSSASKSHHSHDESPSSSSSLHIKNTSYLNNPNGPPITLREKMHLLNNDPNPSIDLKSDENSDSGSISDCISESVSEAQSGKMYTTRRKSQNQTQDGKPANFFQTFISRSINGSDIDSNVSTVGDDASFSRNIQNLSPPVGVREGNGSKK